MSQTLNFNMREVRSVNDSGLSSGFVLAWSKSIERDPDAVTGVVEDTCSRLYNAKELRLACGAEDSQTNQK
jgi:hypothetical protein